MKNNHVYCQIHLKLFKNVSYFDILKSLVGERPINEKDI